VEFIGSLMIESWVVDRHFVAKFQVSHLQLIRKIAGSVN
jgi:hypothetical protein